MSSYSAVVSENKRFWEILVDLQVLERCDTLRRVTVCLSSVWECSGQCLHLAGNSGTIRVIRGISGIWLSILVFLV